MITWLFTQVWLWSLAAFLLGAFITWALFVRPLRRRLKAALARPRYAEPLYAEPVYDEAVYDEQVYDEQVYEETGYVDERGTERQPAPLDLLEQPQPWEPPEEHQELDEWDRKPRPWVAPETVRAAPTGTQRLPAPGLPAPEPEPAESAEAAFEPVADPDLDQAAGDNTWFRNPEVEETRAEPRPSQFPPGADEEDSGQLSGQLRSLFEPESATESREPYTPPVGADATQVIPAVPAEPEQSSQVAGSLDGAEGARPLPKRTPQPRAESAQQADAPQIPDSLRRHVEEGRPLPKADEGTDNPADIKLVDNPDDSSPLPRRTPGAGPHPGRDAKWEKPSEPPRAQPREEAAPAPVQPMPSGEAKASSGPMIKGHSASRQYHSPDSPHYDQITADVWFRTPADAEIAGFEPWHSHHPRP